MRVNLPNFMARATCELDETGGRREIHKTESKEASVLFQAKEYLGRENFKAEEQFEFGKISEAHKLELETITIQTVAATAIVAKHHDMPQLTEGTIHQANGIYIGEILNGKKHGKGVFTTENGQVLRGLYEDGKAKSGTLIWSGGEIDFTVIENGLGKIGTTAIFRPKLPLNNLVEITGFYTGDLNNPIDKSKEFEAIILVDGEKCKYKKTGEIKENGITFQLGRLFAVDGYKVYDGRFVNNQTIYQGIDVKPTNRTVSVTDATGNISEVPVRKFANNNGYCYAPNMLTPFSADIAPAIPSLPMVKVPEDYFVIKQTACGLGAFAKNLILKGMAFPYTGMFEGRDAANDHYNFNALPGRSWQITGRQYGNLTRFIQSGVTPESFREDAAIVNTYMEPPNMVATQLAGELDYIFLVAARDILPGEILLFDYHTGVQHVPEIMLFDKKGNVFASIKNGVISNKPGYDLNVNTKLTPQSKLSTIDASRASSLVTAMSVVYKIVIKFSDLFSIESTPNCQQCKRGDIYSLDITKQLQLLQKIEEEIAVIAKKVVGNREFSQLHHDFMTVASIFKTL